MFIIPDVVGVSDVVVNGVVVPVVVDDCVVVVGVEPVVVVVDETVQGRQGKIFVKIGQTVQQLFSF